MKAILKNFIHVLRRFKTASVLNILGLSAALTVFIVCMIQVKYDLTFNHYFKNVNNLYSISFYQNTIEGESRDFRISNQNMETLRSNLPLLDKTKNIQVHTNSFVMHLLDSEDYFEESMVSVDRAFVDLFDIEMLSGSAEDALSDYNRLMISENTAKKFFGDADPIGKTVVITIPKPRELEGGGMTTDEIDTPMTIQAVYKDFPKNTSFENGVLTLLQPDRFELYVDQNYSWSGTMRSYCMLGDERSKKALAASLADKKIIDLLNIVKSDISKKGLDANEIEEKRLELIPISNIQLHYPSESEKGKSVAGVLSMFAIGLVVLLIAYINFMNFITAMAPARIKTINIQKILGAGRMSQAMSVVGEAVLLTLLSLGVALVIIYILSGTAEFGHFFEANMSLGQNAYFILLLTLGLVSLASVVALYPSVYLTAFNPIVSYGGASAKLSGKKLRNMLTTIQFAVSILFIIIAVFINFQYRYMKYNNMGLDKENVVYLENMTLNWEKKIDNPSAYLQKTMSSPYILDATIANYELGTGWLSYNGNKNRFGEHYGARYIASDRNFIDFFGIKVIHNIEELKSKDKKKLTAWNQTFMKSISEQFREEIENSDDMIVEDFNFDKMYKPIENLKIELSDEGAQAFLYFKLPRDGFDEGVKYLQSIWGKMTNYPFELKFLDVEIGRRYEAEQNLSSLLTVFSLIIIIIAIMGVYGLITFNSKYRAKEIAIRKVQGSTIEQILLLLNRGVLIQFVIAFVMAVPLAYYIISRWLEQFPYRTPIYWWVFLLGGVFVLLITIITISAQSYRAAAANPIGALKDE